MGISRQMIEHIEVVGSSNTGAAACTLCHDEFGAIGAFAWNEAKHWAFRHKCSEANIEAMCPGQPCYAVALGKSHCLPQCNEARIIPKGVQQ